ncbi:hypothetical protein FXO38_06897 [Capsicum annuum]|nr:hypothetical protein FXO38_06897 [Capsicum annuum]
MTPHMALELSALDCPLVLICECLLVWSGFLVDKSCWFDMCLLYICEPVRGSVILVQEIGLRILTWQLQGVSHVKMVLPFVWADACKNISVFSIRLLVTQDYYAPELGGNQNIHIVLNDKDVQSAVSMYSLWELQLTKFTSSVVFFAKYYFAGSGRPLLPLDKVDEEEEKERSKSVSYSYSFFHLIFSLASMYSAMLLTGWSISVEESGKLVDVGWPSVWVRTVLPKSVSKYLRKRQSESAEACPSDSLDSVSRDLSDY